MRSFILSLRTAYQIVFVISVTVLLAFLIAFICGKFFDAHQLESNTDLISSVYQVLGTIYAILLTFTLWGVWQNFNEATACVQNEAYALVDLVHIVEASPDWKIDVRKAAISYYKYVLEKEWPTLKCITTKDINANEHSRIQSTHVVQVVQSITPKSDREITIFNQTLTLLNTWLDARRTRILIARGDSAKSLWPLLITGALVLFGFHGLFVAKTIRIWVTLLFGFSLIISITFYLIFSLDCPFAGSLSIDCEPFEFALNILEGNNGQAPC
jgi:hypothetical protein